MRTTERARQLLRVMVAMAPTGTAFESAPWSTTMLADGLADDLGPVDRELAALQVFGLVRKHDAAVYVAVNDEDVDGWSVTPVGRIVVAHMELLARKPVAA